MILSDAGTFNALLSESNKDLDELERAGLLGNRVPIVEMTESASPYGRRFRLRQRAKNLARTGVRGGHEDRMREAVRLDLLRRLPVIRAHPFAVAEDLYLPRDFVVAEYATYRDSGWTDVRTGNDHLLDPLGEATLDAWLT
ncbi:hypothetical protein ACWFNS_04730 [Oerskovia enterophila]